MKMAANSASLSGVMKGATTLVAISELPSGSLSISGCATIVNRSLEKNASGRKTIAIAIIDRSSRSRSSSRCEISVPSASCSGSRVSGLIGPARRRSLGGAGRRRRVDGPRLGRRIAQRVVLRLLLELRTELSSHGAGAPRPAAQVGRELRQSLWSEHQQSDREDQRDLGEADLEHTSDAGLAVRLDGALALLEVRILATQVLDLPGGLLLALVDRLLEAPDGGAEIGADAAQLLRPEEDQGDDEDDEQLTKPDSHRRSPVPVRRALMIRQYPRLAGRQAGAV